MTTESTVSTSGGHEQGLHRQSSVRMVWVAAAAACLLAGLAAQPVRAQDAATTRPGETEDVFTLDGARSDPAAGQQPDKRTFSDLLRENLRVSVDVYSRGWTTHRRGKASWLNAVGLDIHKVFSDRLGDIGTFVFQPFVMRRDNVLPVPGHVEDDDDWEVEFHDFYFNLTRWGRGRSNFKIGRFDVPYGLEVNTDTHVVVRQLIAHENIGMKKDWGFSLNGEMPRFDYEVALTQGSGHEYANKGKNYAVAGRIGTPADRNLVVGISGFHGRVLGDDNILVRRTRGGVDVTWMLGQFTFDGEASVGRDFDKTVFNSLAGANWNSPDDKVQVYVQGVYLGSKGDDRWDSDVQLRAGSLWQVTDHIALSGEYRQDLTVPAGGSRDATFTFQIRFYH